MNLSLVYRNNDQSWLSNFIQIIDDKISKSGVYNNIVSEEVMEYIKQDEDKIKEVTSLGVEESEELKAITIIRENLSRILVKKILIDYLNELRVKQITLNENLNLAFDFYGNGILVWVESKESDDSLEEQLSGIEIFINKKYSQHQIEMSTIVFDKNFGFEFPPKYV